MFLPRRLSQLGRPVLPPGVWEGPEDRPWVVLTFDDGPHPQVTPRILEGLGRANAPATFFLEGRKIARHPGLAQAVQRAGHEVGNHTWSHRLLSRGVCASPQWQVAQTERLLEAVCPGSAALFRPPFGAVGPGGREAVDQEALLPVYWSVVPADWDPLPAELVERRILRALHPGAVILLHAGQPWHAGGKAVTAMVERLVRSLRERGYEVVPMPRMLDACGYTPRRRGVGGAWRDGGNGTA